MSREGALWIGGLEAYMDEGFLQSSLEQMGEHNVVSIKVMKNKFTGEPASYGFINFDNDNHALTAMHKLNGKVIPNTNPPIRFKLNHQSTRLVPGEKDCSIWVGDLTPDVDDLALYKFFAQRFNTCRTAKVVLDNAGFSKGYGFIRFGDEKEQQTALASMMGASGLGMKPIRVSIAVAKNKPGGGHDSAINPTTASAIASMVTGGNHAAAAAAAAAAANPHHAHRGGHHHGGQQGANDYSQYWQYYQNWSQYAAWNQYSQQQQQQQYPGGYGSYEGGPGGGSGYDPNAATQGGSGGAYNAYPGYQQKQDQTTVIETSKNILEGDDFELVEHTTPMDVEIANKKFLARSEDFWDALENSAWWEQKGEEDSKIMNGQ